MQTLIKLKSIGILGRGKSLNKLPKIADKFAHCLLISNWVKEWELLNKYLKGKHVVHFLNKHPDTFMDGHYEKMGITEGIINCSKNYFSFHKELSDRAFFYDKQLNLHFIPDELNEQHLWYKNSGPKCLFYVSEVLRPKTIWIAGLDFFETDYLIGGRQGWHKRLVKKGLSSKLLGELIGIMRQYPRTKYKLATYMTNVPMLPNLEIV